MSVYIFNIDGIPLKIRYIDPEMNSLFIEIYYYYFKGIKGRPYEFALRFGEEIRKYFSNHYDEKSSEPELLFEGIFSNFYFLWIFLLRFPYSPTQELWEEVYFIIHSWEQLNPSKRIHKGSVFYFWGMSSILFNDLDKGFLLMHQATQEDEKTFKANFVKKPAFCFVTLNFEEQRQLFRQKVEQIADFVDGRLQIYRSKRSTSLTLDDLKKKFLDHPDMRDKTFYFVYEVFNLHHLLTEVDPKITRNQFSSLMEIQLLFSFCLLLEALLKEKRKIKKDKKKTFFPQLKYLYETQIPLKTKENNVYAFWAFNSDFEGTLTTILTTASPSFPVDHTKLNVKVARKLAGITTLTLRPMDEDYAIAYGVRNLGGHNIASLEIVTEYFPEIAQSILNAIFYTIELLY